MKMSLASGLRWAAKAFLTGRGSYVLENKVPRLEGRFSEIETLGLYLHVPFCRQICPYCPYYKERYSDGMAQRYAAAVMKEIDATAGQVGGRPITSLYIGGGTPTTMLASGLGEIIRRIHRTFRMQCGIHMESHPNDLDASGLEMISSLGVDHLSIGVESLVDRHLKILNRPYGADDVRAAVRRAVSSGFACVNADMIFAIPHQTDEEVESTARELIELGVDQVAAYPLFTFPYTPWHDREKVNGHNAATVFSRRRMVAKLEDVFRRAGFQRTSVWAFTRPGVPRYCSVTVPRYLGLGAGAGTFLNDVLYFNTFSVEEYINAVELGVSPIALSLELSRRMQLAGWLYWRIYATRFRKEDFRERFDGDFRRTFDVLLKLFSLAGLMEQHKDEIVLNGRGAYWLHVLQDLFSIEYVSQVWGASQENPWPERVVL